MGVKNLDGNSVGFMQNRASARVLADPRSLMWPWPLKLKVSGLGQAYKTWNKDRNREALTAVTETII